MALFNFWELFLAIRKEGDILFPLTGEAEMENLVKSGNRNIVTLCQLATWRILIFYNKPMK